MQDRLDPADGIGAAMQSGAEVSDQRFARGNLTYEFRDADGNVLRIEKSNTLTTVGLNQILNSSLTGSSYTAAFLMGLVSTASFTAISAADTMASHAGWLEGGLAHPPTYTAPRPAATYGVAAGGSIVTGNCTFVFTGSGTVEGAFVVGGTGATNTIDNTGGVLMAAGTLSAVQPVISGNTLIVTHSVTI